MKKTISVILALVIALSTMFGLASVSFAANEPSYSVSFNTKEAYQLDVVTVKINIKNNPGLISLRFQIVYDETVLDLVKINDSGLLKGWTQPSPTVKSPYILRWADSIAASNNTANGTVAELTFKVKDTAALGNTKVTIEHIESRQFDGAKINFTNASAEFTVACPHLNTTEQITKQATHTETGTKAIICNDCGKTVRTESISALGHSFGDWSVTKPSTCTAKGTETRTCSCGATETREIAAKGHNFAEYIVTKEPTITEKGEKTGVCTVCGEKSVIEIPAIGYKLGDVNGDGKITIVDAKWILQSIAGTKALNNTQKTAADVNKDGKITIIDAKWVLQIVAGLRDGATLKLK